MLDSEFTKIVKEAINYNNLNRYFSPSGTEFQDIESHFLLKPNLTEIEKDKISSGGLKLSHAQRRMLIFIVALWDGREADRIFEEGIGSLAKMIHSMDRDNKELLADLIVTYPGWGT